FMCLEVDDMKTYGRWLRVMVTLIFYELRRNKVMPPSGHRVLMILDEFSSLGYLPQIEEGFDTMAKAKVKLVVVLQHLQQAKKHYKESWQGFLENTGLRIFFNAGDETAPTVSRWLGETEISLFTDSASLNTSEQTNANVGLNRSSAAAIAEGGSEADTSGHSHTTSESDSKGGGTNENATDGTSRTKQVGDSSQRTEGGGGSEGSGGSITDQHGSSEGQNEGWKGEFLWEWLNKRFPLFRENDQRGKNHSTNKSRSRARSFNNVRSWQWSNSQGHQRSIADAVQHSLSRGKHRNWNKTRGTSDTTSQSKTNTRSWNATQTQTEGMNVQVGRSAGHGVQVGINETIQKRPLIYPHDLVREFAVLPAGDAMFPGLSIIMVKGDLPAIGHRTYYYDDKAFDGYVDRNPEYPETVPTPLVRPGEVEIELDAALWHTAEDGSQIAPIVAVWFKRPGERVNKGEPLLAIKPGLCVANGYDATITIHAPFSGTMQCSRISASEVIQQGVCVLADVQFHLGEVRNEAGDEVVNHELDRFIAGEHSVQAHHARATAVLALPDVKALAPAPIQDLARRVETGEEPGLQTLTLEEVEQARAESAERDRQSQIGEARKQEFYRYGRSWPMIVAGILVPFIFLVLFVGMPEVPEKPKFVHPYPASSRTEWDQYKTKYDFESHARWMERRREYERHDREDQKRFDEEYDQATAVYLPIKATFDGAVSSRRWHIGICVGAIIVTAAICFGFWHLWGYFLGRAWSRRFDKPTETKTVLRNARREKFFRLEPRALVIAPSCAIAIGSVWLIAGGAGIQTSGLAMLFGAIIGTAGTHIYLLVRRIIWAVTEGELVTWRKRVLKFDPPLSH
ncbi:MAG: type IV secretory system conjugative DNA transfer family protein, partial [Planctomycetota bacterium]